MKEKARKGPVNYNYDDNGDIVDDPLTDHEVWPAAAPSRNIDGKDKVKWYEHIDYPKFTKKIPMLRYMRGSKAKISITTFDEINKVCQQLFECNKSFFRFRVQVDLLAHYIGTRILEQIYIVKQGKKRYPLSQLLEDQENQFEIWDQMKTVKELFAGLCDKKAEGFITDGEMSGFVQRYIDTFSSKDDRVKMAMVIDSMIDKGEMNRARDRMRKKYARAQIEKDKGIKVVE